jgi:hypothetical protein
MERNLNMFSWRWLRQGLMFCLGGVFVFCLAGLGYSQDPGIPDTVRFGAWGTYVPCPPCSGEAVVPVLVFNDEPLNYMEFVFELTGPVRFNAVEFVGYRKNFIAASGSGVFGGSEGKIFIFWCENEQEYIPSDSGIFALLNLTVTDTGFASIDKKYLSQAWLQFIKWGDNGGYEYWIYPELVKSEFHIQPQGVYPGDVNQSGQINLADAIFLANFLLKGGTPPGYLPCADVNADCQINLSDVIRIADYFLKNGKRLLPGCAY